MFIPAEKHIKDNCTEASVGPIMYVKKGKNDESKVLNSIILEMYPKTAWGATKT